MCALAANSHHITCVCESQATYAAVEPCPLWWSPGLDVLPAGVGCVLWLLQLQTKVYNFRDFSPCFIPTESLNPPKNRGAEGRFTESPQE